MARESVKRATKVIVVVIIIVTILGYSLGSYFTLPTATRANPSLDLSKYANYPPLPQSNNTFNASGQSVSYWFMVDVPIANWTANAEYLMPLYILKTSQHLSFPYSNATISISNLNLTVNGIHQGTTLQGIMIDNSSGVISYMYVLGPNEYFSGTINITVSFHVDLILISGIYWHAISEGTYSFSKNLELLK